MKHFKIFDTFQDAALVIDREARVYFANNAALLLFEVPARRFSKGKELAQAVTFEPDPIEALGDLSELTEASQVREVRFESQSGKAGWAQISIQRIPGVMQADDEPGGDQAGDMNEAGDGAGATGGRGQLAERYLVCLRDVSLEKTLHDKYKAELDKKEDVIRHLQVAREKLEEYSRNLERMVAERTSELSEANRLLKTILDSLGQGILVFDSDGSCLPIFSKVSSHLLEGEPTGRAVEDVLKLQGGGRSEFGNWRTAVFAGMLEFDDLVPLAPARYAHSEGLEIFLNYNPMRSESGAIKGVVLVATDRTQEMKALREAERERVLVKKVVRVSRHRESFRKFVQDARVVLGQLASAKSLAEPEEIGRQLHTLKGGAATFALEGIASECHELEERLRNVRADEPGAEHPMAGDSAGSGDISRQFVERLAAEALRLREILDAEVKALAEFLGPLEEQVGVEVIEVPYERLAAWVRDLLQVETALDAQRVGREILRQCMEKPVGEWVQRLEPSLLELADALGKKVAFRIEGGGLTVPRRSFDMLLGSLIHAFRNSIDHGIESPEERRRLGKPEAGRLLVRFTEARGADGNLLRIEISDDGRGVHPERIRRKLIEKGLQEFAQADDAEVIQAILRDDFSTAEQVTEISGRGVGLSAIASEAKKLGGRMVVQSVPGEGVRFAIEVPIRREGSARSKLVA